MIYSFAISIQPLGNGSSEIRFKLMKQDSSYFFTGSSIDDHRPLTTEKFNCVSFGVNPNNESLREFDLMNVDAKLGGQIRIPGLTSPPVAIGHYPSIIIKEDSTVLISTDNLHTIFTAPEAGDEYTYAVRTSVPEINYSVNESGVNIIPQSNYYGMGTIQLMATNIYGARAIDTISVNITAVNDPPQIKDLPDSLSFYSDSSLTLTMRDYGFDVDSPDSLLRWKFFSSTEALILDYDSVTTKLNISSIVVSDHEYIICLLSDDNNLTAVDTIFIQIKTSTSLQSPGVNEIPEKYVLYQNYPNPFNPNTTIKYGLKKRTHVKVIVYDNLGRKIRNLVDMEQGAGYHQVFWDGKNSLNQQVGSGIYYYQITTKDFSKIRKMILLK